MVPRESGSLSRIPAMRVLILGTGNAFTRRHFGSSALIEAPEGHVLLDCPDPIHRVLHEATAEHGWEVDALAIDDIVVTHLHGDHSNGLESFGFSRRIARLRDDGGPSIPRVHTSQPAADRLWSKLAPAMDAPTADGTPSRLEDFFDVRVLSTEHPNQVAGLTVECRFTGHPIPTIGLLVSDGSATLGWSSDTPFDDAHIEWLSRADLIVHESNHGRAHTAIEKLEGLPAEIRARMCLIHTADDFDSSATSLRVLQDGELLEVQRTATQ